MILNCCTGFDLSYEDKIWEYETILERISKLKDAQNLDLYFRVKNYNIVKFDSGQEMKNQVKPDKDHGTISFDKYDENAIDMSPGFESMRSIMKQFPMAHFDVCSTATIAPVLMKNLE